MGIINSVNCRNKSCRYQTLVREGAGWTTFRYLSIVTEEIKSGGTDDPGFQDKTLQQKIRDGAELDAYAVYLCPKCKKFMSDPMIYLKENIVKSPYGTVRFEATFPFGMPHCPDCNTELKYIQNVRSSKVKCPKCGSDLKCNIVGHWD